MSETSANRRRRYYVDDMVQGRLLALLLATEVVLVLGLLVVLDRLAESLLEQYLYRGHFSEPPSLSEVLAPVTAGAVMVMLVLNCGLVLVLERLWSRQVGGIVDRFRTLTRRTRDLDLRADGHLAHEHPSVTEMLRWRADLRERQVQLSAAAARLDADVDPRDREGLERQRDAVRTILETLERRPTPRAQGPVPA